MAMQAQEAGLGRRCRIRPFRPEDRPAVREICAATGLLGDDIRRLFPRPDFFVDLFTSYYTDLEPDSCLVAEAPGAEGRPQVVGYLLGCTNPRRYGRHQPLLLARITCRVVRGLLQGEFSTAARSYLWWTVRRGWRRECPGRLQGAPTFTSTSLKSGATATPPCPWWRPTCRCCAGNTRNCRWSGAR